jgi:CubicO group peptidase (beta-lactamase class C family)
MDHPPAPLTAGADYLLAEAEAGRFVGVASVSLGGHVVLEVAHGVRDLATGDPHTPQTCFRIGSITKQFTAMAVMILADRAQLSHLDPIGRHLDELPEAWRHLTIHQLLTHTSGLTHSWELAEFVKTIDRPRTLEETIALFTDEALLFEPGTDFHYSGLGYFLLARIVEVVSGVPYDRFLQQEIFEPLAMASTGSEATVGDARYARGYVRRDDGTLSPAEPIYVPVLTGGGHLHSTVCDLRIWDRALAARKLASRAAYQRMLSPEREGYAYGWHVIESNSGKKVYWHAGGLNGFSSLLIRNEAHNLCVVLLSNVQLAEVGPIGEHLVRLARATRERRQ